jgi:hypothetical protein
MEKTLNIYSQKKGDDKFITITHSFERDERKSQLYLTKSDEESLKKKIKAIHDKLKTASTYVGIGLNFEEIDYYTSETDMYLVPYFGISKGERSVRMGYNNEGSIPKGWEETMEVAFKNCKQYGAVLKAVEALGYTLDVAEVKDLKKALKDGYEFEKFVEVQQRRTYW